ncbi:MAG: hypothetical protein U0R71_01965 [Solirubrobacterales bacterium]
MSSGGSTSGSGNVRLAYRPSTRVRLASDVATLCAVGLLIGVLGSAVTWWDRAALFDFAQSSRQVVKLGAGYLIGPLAILIVLPLVFGRGRQVALARWYRSRLVLASLLWISGGVVILDRVGGLGDEYTLQAGAYIAAGLIAIGLAATLAMWPAGLAVVEVDPAGRVREAPASAPSR